MLNRATPLRFGPSSPLPVLFPPTALSFAKPPRHSFRRQVCQEKEIVLDGIVFAEEESKKDRQSKICAQLQSKGVLKSNVSIVLLAESEMEDKETYRQSKENLEEQMSQIETAVTEENARVNAVVYNGSKLDIEQIKGNGQEWIEQYLQKGCPEEMKRPLFVGKSVVYLLSAESKYSTGILIPINK